MTEQEEQIQQVWLALFVTQFVKDRLATQPDFAIEELIDFVTKEANAASVSLPPEKIDAVIEIFRSKADVAAHQGASTEPFWAVIAAIEWAFGCLSTAEWIPDYLWSTNDEVFYTFDRVRPRRLDPATQATDAVFEKDYGDSDTHQS